MAKKGYVRLPAPIAKAIGRTYVSPEDASDILEVWEAELRRKLRAARKPTPKRKPKKKPKRKPARKPKPTPVYEFTPTPEERAREVKPPTPKYKGLSAKVGEYLEGDRLVSKIHDERYCHGIIGTYWDGITVEFSRPVELHEDIRYIYESIYNVLVSGYAPESRVSVKVYTEDLQYVEEAEGWETVREGWKTIDAHYMVREIMDTIGDRIGEFFTQWPRTETLRNMIRLVHSARVEIDTGIPCKPTDMDRKRPG